jgi:hypothetical protein
MSSDVTADTKIKCGKSEIVNIIERGKLIEIPEEELFGWDGGSDRTQYAQNAIKRFRLKKLKSQNDTIYYFDNVYYFIWKYEMDSSMNEERLVRPDESVCGELRELNDILFKPFLDQPQEFW